MNPLDLSLLGLATLASLKPLKNLLTMVLGRVFSTRKVATPS